MGWLVTAPLQRFERRSTSTLAHPRSPRRLSQNLSQSSQASPKALRTSGSTPNITSHSKNVPSINVVLSEPPADPTEIPPHSVGQGHSRPPSDPKFLSAPSPILLHHASDPPPSLAASFHATLGVPASAPTSFTAGPSMDEAPIGKGDGSGSPSTVPHMNPLDDNTDPTPFASKPYILAALVHPKTLKDLDTMGGLEGLCVGLVPNTTKGPSTHSLGQGARDGENSGGEGAFAADRQRVYGANSLPTRSSKSFALKDKILVCEYHSPNHLHLALLILPQVLLCIAAIVPLALVIYQDVGVVHKPEPCTNDPTRPCDPPRVDFMEGVAIMIAIMNDVLVASLNDWQKVRQFRALNEKKEDRTVKVIRNGMEQQVNIIVS